METGFVPIGRVTKLHGVRGKVKVDYYGEDPRQVSLYREVWIKDGSGRLISHEILDLTPQPARLILQLKGIQTADEALSLVGREICVRQESLPDLPEGEYYWFEIVGMRVEASGGELLGRVKEILPTGGHDVYVVQGEKGEILLPAVEGVIQAIDPETRTITVAWMDGLWEKEDEV
jgi:16S rRNA processing protein RimM